MVRSARRGLLPPPLGRERLRALGESRLEPRLELVDRRAVALPLFDGEGRQRLERRGEQAALPAEDGGVLRLERVPAQRRGGVESREEGVEVGEAGSVAHLGAGLVRCDRYRCEAVARSSNYVVPPPPSIKRGRPPSANGPIRATGGAREAAPMRGGYWWLLATSASLPNASLSRTARSARTFRLISTPPFLSPATSRL